MATSFPPHKSLPSKPVSAQIALQHLTAYLDAAASTPHLLPNATLQPTGPVAQSDATSNLTIQHLQRVQAGLRGEWLAPTLDMEEDTIGDVAVEGSGKGKKTTFDDDWVDMDTYNQAQEVVNGDGVNSSVHAEMVDESAEKIETVDDGKMDKETRKREKKEREKKEKKDKAEKARLAAAASA